MAILRRTKKRVVLHCFAAHSSSFVTRPKTIECDSVCACPCVYTHYYKQDIVRRKCEQNNTIQYIHISTHTHKPTHTRTHTRTNITHKTNTVRVVERVVSLLFALLIRTHILVIHNVLLRCYCYCGRFLTISCLVSTRLVSA